MKLSTTNVEHRSLSSGLFILFSLLLLISACATTQYFEARMNGWLGQSEDMLISQWGSPDKSYELDDTKKIVTYVLRGRTMHAYYGYGVGETITPTCELSFVIKDKRVIHYSYKGDGCKAQPSPNERIVTRPNIGIYLQGNTVIAVRPGYPAEGAGIKTGSTIVSIDGVAVSSNDEIGRELSNHSPGDTVRLTVKSDGQESELTLRLASTTMIEVR